MTKTLKLLLVAGARPNFMKIAPVIRKIQQRPEQFQHVLVHTGQHYDEGMSEVFFRDLGIPKPHHHLNVGSGTHAIQSANIMTTFEPIVESEAPDCVLVFGDVNSTLACSIVAKKSHYPVAHVEAGLRSGDMSMPEEVNRMVTDAISDYFFVTEQSGVDHLLREGHEESSIYYVGHVMIDNLYYEVERLAAEDCSIFPSNALKERFSAGYGVVTLHRPSNVDDESTLRGIIAALGTISSDLPLIFPIHPRTKGALERFGIPLPPKIMPYEPLGYREFLNLWRDARLVLTDSGGLQEETTGLGVRCLTLRHNTERPVTVHEGSNRIVGMDPEVIIGEARRALSESMQGSVTQRPSLWDGRASGRILDALHAALSPAR